MSAGKNHSACSRRAGTPWSEREIYLHDVGGETGEQVVARLLAHFHVRVAAAALGVVLDADTDAAGAGEMCTELEAHSTAGEGRQPIVGADEVGDGVAIQQAAVVEVRGSLPVPAQVRLQVVVIG